VALGFSSKKAQSNGNERGVQDTMGGDACVGTSLPGLAVVGSMELSFMAGVGTAVNPRGGK
jgi:hypothetical protein